MATSGLFSTGSYDGRYLTFSWSRSTYDLASNTTTISYSLKGAGTSGYVICGPIELYINGSRVYYTEERVNVYNTTVLKSGTLVIPHNSDGTKTFTVRIHAAIWSFQYNQDVSQNFTLDSLPRASTISANKSTVTLGDTIVFTINRKVSSYVDSIQVGIDGYVNFHDIVTKTSDTSFTWTLPKSWAQYFPSGQRLRVRVQTFNGSTSIGYNEMASLIVKPSPDMAPIADVMIEIVPQTGPVSKYDALDSIVKLQTKIKVTGSATFYEGASGASQFIKIGDSAYNNVNVVETADPISETNLEVVYSVTDTRGLTGSKTITPYVFDWWKPELLTFSVNRCDANGNLIDDGAYAFVEFDYNIAPIGNSNTKKAIVSYKKHSDTNYTNQNITLSEYEGTASVIVPTDGEFIWDILLEISDDFSSSSVSSTLGTAYTLVDYHVSGRGIAFGKVAENADLIDSDIYAQFRNGLAVGSDINSNYVEIGTFTESFVTAWKTKLNIS